MFTNFENMQIQPEKAIRFFYLSEGITLRSRKKLKHFMNDLLKREGKTLGHVNFIFCSDEYLLDINKEYLKHNFYTDIITFDLSEDIKSVEAEIYISTDRVRDNASHLGVSIKMETLRVVFHGLLHLCGYNDKTQKEKKAIRQQEDHYMELYKRH
jgi:rRNA maturation RNase YbeY